jgi:hypothetical protein
MGLVQFGAFAAARSSVCWVLPTVSRDQADEKYFFANARPVGLRYNGAEGIEPPSRPHDAVGFRVLGIGIDVTRPSRLVANHRELPVFVSASRVEPKEVIHRSRRPLHRFRFVGPHRHPGRMGHQQHVGSPQRRKSARLRRMFRRQGEDPVIASRRLDGKQQGP